MSQLREKLPAARAQLASKQFQLGGIMVAQKPPGRPQGRPEAPVPALGRKPWVKRTPVSVVLDQIPKQRARVAEIEKTLNAEKRELDKLEKIRKVLEED